MSSFWSSPQNENRNFCLSLHHRGWCSAVVITSSHPVVNLLSNPSRLLTSALCLRNEYIRLWLLQNCAEDLGPPFFSSCFYLPLSFTHDRLTDDECFGLGHSEVSCTFCCLSAFSYHFSSLSVARNKPPVLFLISTFHITLHVFVFLSFFLSIYLSINIQLYIYIYIYIQFSIIKYTDGAT